MLILNSKIRIAIKRVSLIFIMAVLTACTNLAIVTYASTEAKRYVHIPRTYVAISCVSHDGAPYISDFEIEEPIASGPLGGKIAYGASCGGLIAAGYAAKNGSRNSATNSMMPCKKRVT